MGDVPKTAAAVLVFAGAALWQRKRKQQRRSYASRAVASRSASEDLRAALFSQNQSRPPAYQNPTTVYATATTLIRRSLPFIFAVGLVAGATMYQRELGAVSVLLLIPALRFFPSVFFEQDKRSGRVGWGSSLQQRQEQTQIAEAHLQALNGSWIKDKVMSDSMEPALQVMRLGKLVRSAVRLVKGVRIRIYDDCFEMAVFSAIPWFKVVEVYPLSGSDVKCKRRDLRRGHHIGRATVTDKGEVALTIAWQDPLGGTGTELFRLTDPDTMHIFSSITVNGQTIRYTNVHRRQ